MSFLVPASEIHVSLDASSNGWLHGKPGLGGYNHALHHYFSCTVPEKYSSWCIADLELVAHVIAFHLWASKWERQQVTVHTDNQACFWLLTKGRSQEDLRLQMSRWLCMEQVDKNFRMSSAWTPTAENTLADSLSRWGDPKQAEQFENYARTMPDVPCQGSIF